MELILLKDVEAVGRKGQVVRVRDGYARNFLFPQTLAVEVTKQNLKFVEEQKARAATRHAKEKATAEKAASKLGELKVTIEARAGEQGKLFGSVTTEDIATALQAQGHKFVKKQISLKDPIRTLGSFPVTVELYPEVKASLTVEVVPKA